ncbi:MAG: nucleoside deaminase [Rikenellaceae bacterium]|nr:nucleoside deaminase [Rikenellaceae bacterium]
MTMEWTLIICTIVIVAAVAVLILSNRRPRTLTEKRSFSADDARFMRMAIGIAEENVDKGGGPFGAVIVRNGEVLATGVNRVVPNCDPTAHAEVSAIREACQKTGNFKLEGCTVYSSCEPCPMCLSALYWAGVERICYGNTKADAKAINFDDSFIYDELELDYDKRSIRCEHFLRDEALGAFRKWAEKEDKVAY